MAFNSRIRAVLLVAGTFIGIAIVVTYGIFVGEHRYAFSGDSAIYLQMAKAILHGNLPTTVSPWGLSPIEGTEPARHFPPGFPALIAGVALLTGDLKHAAVLPGRICAALIPFALMLSFRSVMPIAVLCLVGVLVALSPGVLKWHFMAYSDITFLVFSIVSLGLLCDRDGRATRSLIASGAIAGLAFTIRNAGVALLVAAVTGLAIRWARFGFTEQYRREMLTWVAAAAAPVFLLFVYNTVFLSSVQPYPKPTGTRSPIDYLAPLIAAQLVDVGAPRALSWSAQQVPLLIGITAIFAWTWLCSRVEPRLFLPVTVLGLYVVTGAAMVITFNALYAPSGAEITVDDRLVLQYSWPILMLLGITAGRSRSLVLYLALSLSLALLLAYRGVVLFTRDFPQITALVQDQKAMADDAALIGAVRALPPNAFIVSNQAYVFRVETGRDVRQHEVIRSADAIRDIRAGLVEIRNTARTDRPMYLVLTCHKSPRKLTPCSAQTWQDRQLEGFHHVRSFHDHAVIFEKNGNRNL